MTEVSNMHMQILQICRLTRPAEANPLINLKLEIGVIARLPRPKDFDEQWNALRS